MLFNMNRKPMVITLDTIYLITVSIKTDKSNGYNTRHNIVSIQTEKSIGYNTRHNIVSIQTDKSIPLKSN